MKPSQTQAQLQPEALQALAESAAAGDHAARDKLLLTLTPMIVRAAADAARITKDTEDAQQDGYLHMLTLIDRYDPATGVCFLHYAKTRLRYYFANRTRYECRRRHASLDAPVSPDDPTPMAETIPDDPVDFDASFSQRERAGQLNRALKRLTPAERKVITLALHGYSNRAIARIPGNHEKTVRNLKSRAKQKMK